MHSPVVSGVCRNTDTRSAVIRQTRRLRLGLGIRLRLEIGLLSRLRLGLGSELWLQLW